MKRWVRWAIAGVLAAGPVWAQEPAPAADARAELLARGAPADLAEEIEAIVVLAVRDGLPTDALVDKALEGWAKRAAPTRIVVAVGDLRHSLLAARDAARDAGLSSPPGNVVSAAAQALGRGMTPDDVRRVIRSAGNADAAATGLMVASSLAAQGIERSAAARTVEQAFKEGHSSSEVLELPSVAASMMARGVTLAEVTRRMLAGNPLAVERPDVAAGHAADALSGVSAAAPARGDQSTTPSVPKKP